MVSTRTEENMEQVRWGEENWTLKCSVSIVVTNRMLSAGHPMQQVTAEKDRLNYPSRHLGDGYSRKKKQLVQRPQGGNRNAGATKVQ